MNIILKIALTRNIFSASNAPNSVWRSIRHRSWIKRYLLLREGREWKEGRKEEGKGGKGIRKGGRRGRGGREEGEGRVEGPLYAFYIRSWLHQEMLKFEINSYTKNVSKPLESRDQDCVSGLNMDVLMKFS